METWLQIENRQECGEKLEHAGFDDGGRDHDSGNAAVKVAKPKKILSP